MNSFRRVSRMSATAAVAATLTTALSVSAAQAAPVNSSSAQLQDVNQLSSQAVEQVNSLEIELPAQAYDLAKQFNVQLPGFIKKPTPAVAGELVGATHAHLLKQGHHEDANAKNIAQEWANQAAAGKVTFHDNAGDGLTHLEEGSGNIYKLTESEAKERVDWLNRDVPVTKTDGTGFGVAQAFDGTYVYVAEYFFNK
ncbi:MULTISPECIES: hypothetical protein [Corynebacterium]|uniref:CAP domain-containing protein n=1 Tax=Corynebacterium aurimucosum TaxID=169292 RepID=A0A2N6TQS2_9CORY|nr:MULTISPECIES: hypothetical protein [Corynebacterium]MTD91184.1 hypothetical protein [Corynebacterium aurimucosum]OFK69295.1 hypothetical protein HMPREF2807_02840 [Corynebacterium sp. HMSC074A09]OFO21418.1 hypothetical protein HMPREF3056_08650 [Corynebacterium sp. HMSC056F09]OFO93930.1 hypothetical protein HMPREF3009_10725 [Corynebacterium sp. HMSC034H07]OFP31884.1 hypothetical protein HMPREF2993_06540 [Corynebacterium sp. HMSC068G04]